MDEGTRRRTAVLSARVDAYDALLRLQAATSFSRERRMLDCEQLREADTILDLGCGNGAFTSRLAEALPAKRFIGIDPNRALLARGRSRGVAANVTLLEGTIDDVPDDLAIDFLVLRLVTPYLRDPETVAAWAFARVRAAIVIDPDDALRSIRPDLPGSPVVPGHAGGDVTASERDAHAHTLVVWQRAGYTLDDEQEIVVRVGAGASKVLLHQLVALGAEVAAGEPLDEDMRSSLESWCLNEASSLQYGMRARRFARR